MQVLASDIIAKHAPTRRVLAVSAFLFMGGVAIGPAYAVPFTDIHGNHCDTSQLMTDPSDPGGPSVCPGGGGGGGGGGRAPIKSSFTRLKFPWVPQDVIDDDEDPEKADWDSIAPLILPPDRMALRLGMSVAPDSGFDNGVGLGVGGYSVRNKGVGVTDTAGLFAPGSVSTASRTSAGSGGISGSYDASNFVGPNQKFILSGGFNYTSLRTNYAAAAGSINSDLYGFKGSALYRNYNTYLVLKGRYEFGYNNEFFAADASSGSYRS